MGFREGMKSMSKALRNMSREAIKLGESTKETARLMNKHSPSVNDIPEAMMIMAEVGRSAAIIQCRGATNENE